MYSVCFDYYPFVFWPLDGSMISFAFVRCNPVLCLDWISTLVYIILILAMHTAFLEPPWCIRVFRFHLVVSVSRPTLEFLLRVL
ncbi:hypothetical protein BDV06DRAFT_59399 [Aspergillus oleicola]